MTINEPRVLLDGLYFPECPRWRDGRLYFVDFYAHEVVSVDLEGRRETIAHVPGQPGGLGWAPNGDLLVVSMMDSKLLRLRGDILEEVADYSKFAHSGNDMVVDGQGRAYIGAMPPLDTEDPSTMGQPVDIVMVEPDGGAPNGGARVVASDLLMPNGAVVTPDGSTLIVAESFASRLVSFTIEPDGTLSDRAVFAQLEEGLVLDGICLDAEGCIWVAILISNGPTGFLRVAPGGKVLERIDLPSGIGAAAVALGGDTGNTLFLLESLSTDFASRAHMQKDNGRIRVIDVDVPAAAPPRSTSLLQSSPSTIM